MPSAVCQSLTRIDAPQTKAVASTRLQPEAMLMLPDSPGAVLEASSSAKEPERMEPLGDGQFGLGRKSDAELAKHPASVTEKFISPGQIAPKLTAGDKVELGLIHAVSPFSVAGWFVSAGYSHLIDGSPNYGVDKGAFGQRLGSAALRGTSNELFTDSVMAPLFHQDPRYYKMGPRRSIPVRTLYAVSRALVTRNDNGHLEPNYSVLSGNLLGSALSNAYFPEANRGFGQTARTFGNSMSGAAFSFFAGEFVSSALEAIHLKESHD